jgi:hypothetical protein
MNTFSKQPAETYTIGVDFTGKLPAAATISSGTVAAVDAAGTDMTGTVLASGTATIVGNEARVKVLAGVHGQDYRIRFQVTLSNSDLLEEDVLMRVGNL